jgi:hypothetical protein
MTANGLDHSRTGPFEKICLALPASCVSVAQQELMRVQACLRGSVGWPSVRHPW